MSEINDIWTQAKRGLSDAQKAQLPKQDLGKKGDEFEASIAKALKELSDANTAVWAAFVDGSKPRGESVRDLVSRLSDLCGKDKAINQVIGKEILRIDRLAVGKLNGLMKQYEENLKKSLDSIKETIKS